MEKKVSAIFALSLIILLSSIGFTSAGLWGDVFGKITGMATTSGPGLQIQSNDITPTNPFPGDAITIEVVVENNGGEKALSQTSFGTPTSTKNSIIISGANPQIITDNKIIDILPGATQTFTFTYLAENEGQDSLSIKIDDKDSSFSGKKVPIEDRSGTVATATIEISNPSEKNETSNQTTTETNPTGTSPDTDSGTTAALILKGANTYIKNYQITPTNPFPGDPVTIEVVVENNGGEKALSQDYQGNPTVTKNTVIISGANPQTLVKNKIIDILPGATQTFTFTYLAENEGQDSLSIKIDDKDSLIGKKVNQNDWSDDVMSIIIRVGNLSSVNSSTIPQEAQPEEQLPKNCVLFGDVNYNGHLDEDDANLVQEMAVRKIDADICGDISKDGRITGYDAALILSEVSKIIEIIECTDGTISGSCSTNAPSRCEMDVLVNDCQNCGCPSGQECQSDGSCAENLCTTVKYSGDPEDKLDILYLGDDYSSSEQSKFAYYVRRFMNNLLSYEPFESQSNKINVYRIDGIEDLGCNYNCGGTARRLCCDNTKIAKLASQCPYDQIAIIVNNEQYGGSGGTYAISYRGNPMTGLHEFGHSFGRLRDEYSYGSYNGYDHSAYLGFTGNCDPTPGCPMWEDVPGAGCTLGCQYDEWYRPAPTVWRGGSIMRDSSGDFNPVGEKILSEKLEDYT